LKNIISLKPNKNETKKTYIVSRFDDTPVNIVMHGAQGKYTRRAIAFSNEF
jgi:hypothetical protein